MSRLNSDIIYQQTGQTLSYRVMIGQPTSGSYKVFWDWASEDNIPEFQGSVVVDTFSQNPTATSGQGQTDPTNINLTTTGMLIDRPYLVSEGKKSEWFFPVEIGTGFARSRHALRNSFTTAATVVSTTVTGAVDDTWVQNYIHISQPIDPHPRFRVRWAVVVNGLTYTNHSFFDVVRATVDTSVTVDDLDPLAPGVVDGLPPQWSTEQGRPLIQAAWESTQALLTAIDIDTKGIRDAQVMDELVKLRALVILAEGGWRPKSFDRQVDFIKIRQDAWTFFFDSMVKVRQKVSLAPDQTGSHQQALPRDVWAK